MTSGDFAATRRRTRVTLTLAVSFIAYCIVALRLDAGGDASSQLLLSLSAWVFLFIALRASTREQRGQALAMIGVATLCECFGSIVWGAYRYRLENLPLYVPAGHGLLYLIALRLADVPGLRGAERLVVPAVVAGATALAVRNVLAAPTPDAVGLITWGVFVYAVVRSRLRLLYAVSFTLTMALEFYGTSIGSWTWAPALPVVGLAAANPPAGIGAGYCAMDHVARRIAPRARRAAARIEAAVVRQSLQVRQRFSPTRSAA